MKLKIRQETKKDRDPRRCIGGRLEANPHIHDIVAGRNAEVVSLTQDIGDFAKKINSTFGNQQKQQIISTIANIEDFVAQLNDFMTKNKDIISSEDKENLHFIISNFSDISDNFKLLILLISLSLIS